MRRIVLVLAVLSLLAAACGDDGTFGTTTTATGTSGGESTTTTAGSTTSPASTTEATTTTAATTTTTTVPGATAVGHTAYCVRGTASNDALNVRSGPGTGFDVVAELAWNAAAVPAGGFTAPDQLGRPWLMVGYEGGMGWAAGWYLEPAPCEPAVIAVAPMAGPGLPDALAGGLVPWTWVDADWVLALYAPDWDGPFALYLLSPFGDVYEVFTWAGGIYPFHLHDWRPDGKAALAMVGFDGNSNREIRLLDLEARSSRTVLTIPALAFEGAAAFTRPTGRDLVIAGGDAATELIEVRRTDGSLFSTLVSRPRPADWLRQATWIYGLEGTTVVVGDGDRPAAAGQPGRLDPRSRRPGRGVSAGALVGCLYRAGPLSGARDPGLRAQEQLRAPVARALERRGGHRPDCPPRRARRHRGIRVLRRLAQRGAGIRQLGGRLRRRQRRHRGRRRQHHLVHSQRAGGAFARRPGRPPVG